MFDPAFLARYGRTPDDVAARLQAALEEFEATLQAFTRGGDERWFQPLAAGKWSAAQQAEHVLKANVSFAKIAYLLGTDRPLPDVKREPGALVDGKPVAPDFLQPGPGVPWPELEGEWRASHDRVLKTVRSVNPEGARVFWHPLLGDLTAMQWTQVAVYHTRSHHKQLMAGQEG